jgi:hypothetical protein
MNTIRIVAMILVIIGIIGMVHMCTTEALPLPLPTNFG